MFHDREMTTTVKLLVFSSLQEARDQFTLKRSSNDVASAPEADPSPHAERQGEFREDSVPTRTR